jgi:hypothetical protein
VQTRVFRHRRSAHGELLPHDWLAKGTVYDDLAR